MWTTGVKLEMTYSTEAALDYCSLGVWIPTQPLVLCRIQCRKPKFWCHLGLPQLVVSTKWFKLGLTDTSACRNSIKCVPLVALCFGNAALDMCRKKKEMRVAGAFLAQKLSLFPLPSAPFISPCSCTKVVGFFFSFLSLIMHNHTDSPYWRGI